jgi:outer membrane protein TolC
MRLKIIFSAAFVLIINLFAGYSQVDTLMLTLNDALKMAQARSSDALIAKQNFRINYWQYRSFKADYLPSVILDAGQLPDFSRSFESVLQPDGTVKNVNVTSAEYQAIMTVNEKVGFTGGSVFVRSQLYRSDNFFTDSTSTSYRAVPITIGYSQPLFQYNEYRWARKLEPLDYEKAKRKYMEDLEQISITTINHFFNLLQAQIEVIIAQKNFSSYDTLFKIANGRYQLGKIAENELLQLELNFLQAKASVDNASLNYENMLFRLKSYLRLKNEVTIQLLPPGDTRHDVISAARAVDEARKNSSSSIDFQQRLITAESQVNRAKKEGRFDANLYVEYGLNQSAATIPDSYKNPDEFQQVNFGMTIPILDWGKARGQIKVQESNLELEQTSVEQEIIDFEQNIFLTVMQFNMQKNQLFIAAKADTVAQKRYDVTQKRYMIGQVNDVLELNNAQIDNDNARMGYYSALRNYWINYYQLRKMTLYDFLDNKMLIFDAKQIL